MMTTTTIFSSAVCRDAVRMIGIYISYKSAAHFRPRFILDETVASRSAI